MSSSQNELLDELIRLHQLKSVDPKVNLTSLSTFNLLIDKNRIICRFYLSIYSYIMSLTNYQYISLYLSIYVSMFQSIYISFYLSFCLTVCLSNHICISIYVASYLSAFYLYICNIPPLSI